MHSKVVFLTIHGYVGKDIDYLLAISSVRKIPNKSCNQKH